MTSFLTFRFGAAVALCFAFAGAHSAAAESLPEPSQIGACAVVSPDNEVTSYAACEKLPTTCGAAGCDLFFQWPSGSLTVISSTTTDIAAGVRINGKPAETPANRPPGVGGTCLRNTVSTRLFCWESGVRAADLATTGAAPPAPTLATQTSQVDQTANVLDRMQGLYRLSPEWSCRADQIGMDGGAMAVQGDKLMGVESVCALRRPTAVGTTGAVLVRAECSGEGETFAEDMILFRDDTSLTILRPAGKITWTSCD